MRVFLDARMFYHSGIGRYGRSLYQELQKFRPALEITLGLDTRVSRRFDAEINYKPKTLPFRAPIYSLREQLGGSYLRYRYQRQYDLFHFPHYNMPWFCPASTVVTTHGLSHLLFPQYFDSLKVAVARRLLRRVADKATAIIAVSQTSKQAFLRFFPQAESKLRVIYNGVNAEFCPLPATDIAEFKRQQQLEDFLLYVGICKPIKNLPRLIAAYAQLKGHYPELKLVILNQQGRDEKISEAITKWKVEGEVVFRKLTSTRALVLYYNAAQLLVFPSLYEGFGLPPLEAMACGTPVVSSNVASIPEVVGEAGILVDPLEVDSIVDGMEQGLSDTVLREKLRQQGLVQAKKFTWRNAAYQTWQVYQEIVT